MDIDKKKVKRVMRQYLEDCRDNRTGEINHTLLAETAAAELELYENEDYDIPEEVFEIALEFN